MKRMFGLFGLLAMIGVLFVACTEDPATAPEEASFGRKVSNGCVNNPSIPDEPADQLSAILTEINNVYTDRKAISGAEQIVDNIARQVCKDTPNYDATPSMAEGFYQHVVNELEHLTVPLAQVIDLVELVFDFALPGDAPTFPEGAFDEETGTVAVILPGTDDVVQTPNFEAALVVDPASFGPGDPVTVVLTRIPDDETPIPGFVNFAERYSVFVSREPAVDGEGVLVAVCVPDDQDLPAELALGHTFDGQVEILVPVDPGEVLDCTQAQSGYPFVGAVLGLAGVTSRWIQPVVDRILGVEPLHASYLAGTGLGGRTKSFSPFAPVDPTIEVGETVQLTIGTDNVDWSSGNEAVATVDDFGLVSGVGVGTATITALVSAVAYTIDITVEPLPVPDVIGFEIFPNGQAVSASQTISDQYAAWGLYFSEIPDHTNCTNTAPQIWGRVSYDPPGSTNPYAIGNECSIATVIVDLPPATGTVTYELTGRNDIALFDTWGVDGTGARIPESAVSRIAYVYQNWAGIEFRTETITITATEIAQIRYVTNLFLYLFDNLDLP